MVPLSTSSHLLVTFTPSNFTKKKMAQVLNFLAPLGALLGGAWGQTGVETNLTTYMYPDSSVTAESAFVVNGSRVAPKGAKILTVGVIGGKPASRDWSEGGRSKADDIRLWLGWLGTFATPVLLGGPP